MKSVSKDKIDLKTYLMSDFHDKQYRHSSLIEIYISEGKYYNNLKKRHLIEEEAISFFQKKDADLRDAEAISVEAFRKLKYVQIIEGYIAENTPPNKYDSNEKLQNPKEDMQKEKPISDTRKEGSGPSQIIKKVKNARTIHCPKDLSSLIKIGEKGAKAAKKKFKFPMYQCSQCQGLYTSLNEYTDLIQIRFDGKKYTNITLIGDDVRYGKYLRTPKTIESGSRCFTYGTTKVKLCKECSGPLFEKRPILFKTKKGKNNLYYSKFCTNCHIYFIDYSSYLAHKDEWIILNEEELPLFEEELLIKREEKAKRKAEKKEKQAALAQQLKEEQIKKQQEQEKKRKEKAEAEQKAKEIREQRLIEQQKRMVQKERTASGKNKVQTNSIHEHDNNIRVRDFVVRRTTFKCMHQDHKLQNIDALINIIDKNGDVNQAEVSAGYCPNCNIFFIMESTYQSIRMKGTPVCRVSDEKAYLKNNVFANGMQLAQESILMQYGYSVSQGEGVSAARRRKILALLVDNGVLTKSDIISYLDFFINQRKYQQKFEKAIEKWETDREFISEYRSGNYTQYGVSGIYRKY